MIEPKFKVNLDNPLKSFPLYKPNNEVDSNILNTFSGPVSNNCSLQPSFRNFDKSSKGIDLEHAIRAEPPKEIIEEETTKKNFFIQTNIKRNNIKELYSKNNSKITTNLNSSHIQINHSGSKNTIINKKYEMSPTFDKRRNKKCEAVKIPFNNLNKNEYIGKIKNDLIKMVKTNYHQYVNTTSYNYRTSNNSSSNSKYLYTCETSSNKTHTKHLNTSKDLKNTFSDSKYLRNKKK